MRIDLHTHSDRSDGTLTPAELVRHAAELSVDVVALTDHDTFDGWEAAGVAAAAEGVTLVRGIEISCRHRGQSVHLLGYLPDPTYQPLLEELRRVLDGRNARLPAILDRLRGLGIEISLDDVRAVSPDAAATGRPHVADALVRLGVVRDRDEAFARYLSQGKPAYVDRYAADLVGMLGLLAEAGGVAVLAHPWGRYDRNVLTPEVLAELGDQGLTGVEVDHEDHDPETRAQLRSLATELGLVMTGSSDFHGSGKVGHDLACNTTEPEQLERLLACAEKAAQQSGRRTPAVLR